jgi:hypothetical protein
MIDSHGDDALALHRRLDEERRVMHDILLRVAVSRETDPDARIDARYVRAADNLRHLAVTMADVPDELILKVAAIHTRLGKVVGHLISARLLAIHFEIMPYASATDFFYSLMDAGFEGSLRRLN